MPYRLESATWYMEDVVERGSRDVSFQYWTNSDGRPPMLNEILDCLLYIQLDSRWSNLQWDNN